ncbi:hypothetical protein EVAR_31408_1 [Eumeta japonica]|uniref:Uncharacterized protein n=1 Tax=Eumeta variegata TaxID=151549 RepID=A0A4C1UXQ0_EUMVA|nr:hypothetical protein EVAR_31408_1 [Eumeta japonica]
MYEDVPIRTTDKLAPEELLKLVHCTCAKDCSGRCGCKKAGLPCVCLYTVIPNFIPAFNSGPGTDLDFDPGPVLNFSQSSATTLWLSILLSVALSIDTTIDTFTAYSSNSTITDVIVLKSQNYHVRANCEIHDRTRHEHRTAYVIASPQHSSRAAPMSRRNRPPWRPSAV